MVIQDKGIVKEGFDLILITSCQVENSFWRNNMTSPLREGEGIIDWWAFRVVVKNLEGINEFCIPLQMIDSWQNFLIKPVFNLEVTRKSRYHKIFKLLF